MYLNRKVFVDTSERVYTIFGASGLSRQRLPREIIFKIKTKNVNENVSTPPSVLIFTLGSQGSSENGSFYNPVVTLDMPEAL